MTAKLLLLIVCWLIYAIIHSLLASSICKQWVMLRFPKLFPGYRLAFNLIAFILIIPPLWLTYGIEGPMLWSWQGAWLWIKLLLTLAATLGFVWSLRYYDLDEFWGIKAWQNRHQPLDEHCHNFTISPLHRFVRHPWYFFALVILWTRDMDAAFLTTSIVLTLYFVIGSHLEEKKLLKEYGERYKRYQEKVPSLIPLPWRYLKADEVEAILTA